MRMSEKRWPDWNRKLDPDPGAGRGWDSYARDFLEPGWAGELSDGQAHYIRDVLQGKRLKPEGVRRSLRAWWGLRGQGVASEAAIREIAMNGKPDDMAHNAKLVREVKRRERAKAEPARIA